MSKKLWLVVSFILAFFLLAVPVKASENEWVYDEAEVVLEETKECVKTLNEEVFATYKAKPQLGIMILNKLPDGYTIDEYKLEQFNQLGVGTKEENCGMLFIFAIKDRKYGFEIGDGFKKGSLLRKDLETDFITSDMKALLKEEKYDAVVLQVVKHLEQIMADEENGVYEKKEAEYAIYLQEKQEKQEAMDTQMEKIGSFLGFATIIGGIAYLIGSYVVRLFRKRKIKSFLESNIKHVNFFKWDIPSVVEYLFDGMFAFDGETFEKYFWDCLYEYYRVKEYEKLKSRSLKHSIGCYIWHLDEENTFASFRELNLKDIDAIIWEVDSEKEREAEIESANHKKIRDYIAENESRTDIKNISLNALEEAMQKHCVSGTELTKEALQDAFEEELKELNFRYAYEIFLKENKDKIDSSHFDSDKFYNSLKKSSEYKNRSNRDFMDYYWMLPLVYHHVHENKEQERRAREARKRAQEEAQKRQSSYTSFGSDFGGGYSSGGGFSGGW